MALVAIRLSADMLSRYGRIACLSAMLGLGMATALPSAAEPLLSAGPRLGFAVSLMHEAEYPRAIEELNRIAEVPLDASEKACAQVLTAECLARIGKPESAIDMFLAAEQHSDPELRAITIVRAADCCLTAGDHRRAREILHDRLDAWATSDLADVGNVLIGLSYFREHNFLEAQRHFMSITLKAESSSIRSLCQELADVSGKCLNAPTHSKDVATGLSALVPGAGQYYAGNKADGLVALSTIALYSILSKQADKTGNESASSIFGVLAVGLYIGNVYGGRRAAIVSNEATLEQLTTPADALADGFLKNCPPASLPWHVKSSSQQDKTATETSSWANILHLFEKRRFRECGTELRRHLYDFPRSEKRTLVGLLIALCTCGEGDFEHSVKQWKEMVPEIHDPYLTDCAQIGLALANFYEEDYESTLTMVGNIRNTSGSQDVKDIATFLESWSQIGTGQYDDASTGLDQIAASMQHPVVHHNAEALQTAIRSTGEPHMKNVETAKTLSRILPGAGQIYSGDIGDGLSAFVVNAAIINQVKEWWESDFHLGAAFLVWQGVLRFYKGNIYNAEVAATATNDRLRERFLSRLEQSQQIDLILLVKDLLLGATPERSMLPDFRYQSEDKIGGEAHTPM